MIPPSEQTVEGARGFEVPRLPMRAAAPDAVMWSGLASELAALLGFSPASADEMREELLMMLGSPMLAPLLALGRERPAVLGIATGAKWVLRFVRERRDREDNETPAHAEPEKDAPAVGDGAEVENG